MQPMKPDRIYLGNSGRGERIRTSGLYVPNVALYQAKLHPDADEPLCADQLCLLCSEVANCIKAVR